MGILKVFAWENVSVEMMDIAMAIEMAEHLET